MILDIKTLKIIIYNVWKRLLIFLIKIFFLIKKNKFFNWK